MNDKSEIIALLQNKQLLEHQLESLSYGSVEIRERGSNKYIYVHYREDGVSLTKYFTTSPFSYTGSSFHV